jgi:predicted GNAT family N-acyltransferase
MQDSLTIRSTTDPRDLEAAMTVRWPVFVEEQGVPADEERDSSDLTSVHVLAEIDGQVVGTGRLVLEGDYAGHIGRIAVLPDQRHRGIATRIIATLEQQAQARGFSEITLHAQTYVQELYAKSGYTVSGPQFLEAGIDHLPMKKRI